MLSEERGEELNTALSAAQGWEVSLDTGLIITDVGSAICSISFSSGDGGEMSTLPKLALRERGGVETLITTFTTH